MKTKKFIIYFLFLLPLFSLTSCGEATKTDENIDFENALFVDVRTPEEYNEGTFEGAINIPLNTIEDNIGQFEGQEQIVVFCKSGNRSGKAIKILESHDIEHLINGVNQKHLEEVKRK